MARSMHERQVGHLGTAGNVRARWERGRQDAKQDRGEVLGAGYWAGSELAKDLVGLNKWELLTSVAYGMACLTEDTSRLISLLEELLETQRELLARLAQQGGNRA